METVSSWKITQESEEQVFGKRKRNEKEWKSNKRKKAKAKGKPFVNRFNKQIPERKTGNVCRYYYCEIHVVGNCHSSNNNVASWH